MSILRWFFYPLRISQKKQYHSFTISQKKSSNVEIQLNLS